jgi:hypothetical protein
MNIEDNNEDIGLGLFYKLDDNKNVVHCTLREYTEFIDENKIIKQEDIEEYFISTVFLGIDHCCMEYRIEVFETMIFKNGEWRDIYCSRYATYNEALEGHKKAVEWVKDGCKDIDDL